MKCNLSCHNKIRRRLSGVSHALVCWNENDCTVIYVYTYKCMRIHWYTYIMNMCLFMSIRIDICTCSYVDMVSIKMVTWSYLTHWGQVTHICISELAITSPDIWTNGRILLIGPLGTTSMKFKSKFVQLSFKKMSLKMSSAKLRAFCLGLNCVNWLPVIDHRHATTSLTSTHWPRKTGSFLTYKAVSSKCKWLMTMVPLKK